MRESERYFIRTPRPARYDVPMSIWHDIRALFAADWLSQAGDALGALAEQVRTLFSGDPQTRRRVAFSVALIALSAKMAKADGVVTHDEVAAFERIFEIPDEERTNVARLYDLAKQDVAGFDAYADKVRALFPGAEEGDDAILRDVLDALFHIAQADGFLHEAELAFLEETASRFGVSAQAFDAMRAIHAGGESNPYAILDAEPHWSLERLRAQYRSKVAESHPDRLIARGVPNEFVRAATDRPFLMNLWIPDPAPARDSAREAAVSAFLRSWGPPPGELAAALPIDFAAMERTPNTIDAHRLIHWAGLEGRQGPVVDALFSAYFAEGRDIGDREVLADIADGAGMDASVVARLLETDNDVELIRQRDAHSREMGVNSVPTFIVGGQHAVPGAQPPELWSRVIAEMKEAG